MRYLLSMLVYVFGMAAVGDAADMHIQCPELVRGRREFACISLSHHFGANHRQCWLIMIPWNRESPSSRST